MPAQTLPGSIATASTLAFALVHKYVDATPLYRLAQTIERAGAPVSRGALGHWVIGSSEKYLFRIYDALQLRLRSQPLIHGDETTVQLLKERIERPLIHRICGPIGVARTVTSRSCGSTISRAAARCTQGDVTLFDQGRNRALV